MHRQTNVTEPSHLLRQFLHQLPHRTRVCVCRLYSGRYSAPHTALCVVCGCANDSPVAVHKVWSWQKLFKCGISNNACAYCLTVARRHNVSRQQRNFTAGNCQSFTISCNNNERQDTECSLRLGWIYDFHSFEQNKKKKNFIVFSATTDRR